ncbi:hypothetical protein Tco_0609958 [Tanacetum coccineum]
MLVGPGVGPFQARCNSVCGREYPSAISVCSAERNVDEFVIPANARFGWFSSTRIVKDRSPTISEYNVDHAVHLLLPAYTFLSSQEEFLCWVGIKAINTLLNKDTSVLRFKMRDGFECFYLEVAQHVVQWTLLPNSVLALLGSLSDSIEEEFVEDCMVAQRVVEIRTVASVGGLGNGEPNRAHTGLILLLETEAYGLTFKEKKRVLPAELIVEQGVPSLPTLPFITSFVISSHLEEGGDHIDSVTGPSLRTVGPFARFIVLFDSSHHLGVKSTDPDVDSFVRSVALMMTAATTVTTFVSNAATMTATPVDVGKDKDAPTPSIFDGSSSSNKTDRTLSLFIGRSGSDFVAGSIRAGGAVDVDLQEIYIPEWSVTKGFELNDGRSCANMIDHFTPPAFFKTVRGMEHEQLFAEFNVFAARNLSLSSEVRMRAEYNILEKRKWKSLAEEKNNLLQVKDKEIEELRSQLLQVKDESMKVAQLRTRVSSLEAIEGSLRGEEHNGLLEQERSALKVHELETSSAGLREKLETYEGSMKQLEEFQDNLMKPLEARLAEIDADFTSLFGKTCVFGRAIEKGMQEGLAAGIEHGQAGRCLSDLEAYNPSAEADFNSVVRDLRGLDFPLLRELSAKKDASTWDVMDLLRLDDAVAKVLGMTDLQPDVGQLMVPVHHKQDKVVIGSQALFCCLETCSGGCMKEDREETLLASSFSECVFVSIKITPIPESLTILPGDLYYYENPDLAGTVPEDVIPGPKGEGKVGGSTEGYVDVGDLMLSQLENEARAVVL